jgi:putative N6-adenine-specific DNA methylase
MKIIVKTFQGLEPVLAEEIAQLGGHNIQIIRRAVEFEGDKRLLYRCNLELRTAIRVLTPIASFRARHESAFYTKMKEIDWSQYMTVRQTLSVDAVVHSTYFTHSQYAALKTKDAIVDQFREKFYKRPNVNTINPDLAVSIHIFEDQVTVLLDSSGESLHKRGYRVDALEAPVNEVLAAGILTLAKWQKDCDLMDAMCGSGTFLTEAALMAYNMPPQLGRDYFCFKKWVDFDATLWEDVLKTAKNKIYTEYNHQFIGSDINFQAIRVTERNVEAATLTGKVKLERKDFFKQVPNGTKGMLILNPPYDERLKLEDVNQFYKDMGDAFKKNWKGWQIWMLSGNAEAIKHVGLRASSRIPLWNGPIECRLLKYEMY